MTSQDIRWKQRFDNYQRALSQLSKAVLLSRERPLSELEQQGLIQAFVFTHELAWNTIKDYFYYQGNSAITGSRDASRQAFQAGLITNGDTWMAMIKSRNSSSHTYNIDTADNIAKAVCEDYISAFQALETTLQGIIDNG